MAIRRLANAHAAKMQLQREQIIQIGLDAFFDKGFEGTTAVEIADKAGISERTFFRYFKTKEELVFDWIDSNGRFAVDVLLAQPRGQSAKTSMKLMHLLLANHIDANREKHAKLARLIYDSPTLSARAHYEYAKWESQFVEAICHNRRVGKKERYQITVAVAVSVAAFVLAVREWTHTQKLTSVRPWVMDALASI